MQEGKKAEDLAIQFLEKKGYRLVARNYRYKRNEIDAIMRHGDVLIFVEVKMRSSNYFGYPESFLSEPQAARIIEAADEYIFRNNWTRNIRFDIISIEKTRNGSKITHFEDAFH